MTVLLINGKTGGGAEKIVEILKERTKTQTIYLDEITGIKNKIIRIFLHIYAVIKLAYFIKKNKVKMVISFLERSNLVNVITGFITGHIAITSVRINLAQEYRTRPWYIYIAKFIYKRADRIIAVSKGVKSMLVELGVPDNKIEVIYNGVEIGYPYSKREKIILGAGRLEKQKNFELLLKAFSLLNKPEYKLYICGSGRELKKLQNLTEKLCIADSVVFTGWVNMDEMLKKTKVFVLTSLWEGFPNVILEALAYGVPVVSVNAKYGVDEILENKYGIICSYSPVDIRNKILSLLENNELWKFYSETGLKRAEEFSIKKMVDAYTRFIK